MAKKNGLRIKTLNLKRNLQGVIQNLPETFIPATAAKDIINMHSLQEGSWTADLAGYTKINSGGTAYESGASIDGLYWFSDSAFADHLFMACNGKLKEINTSTGAATNIDASAGYTVGSQVDFETFNYTLFTCDGNIAKPRKWDGTSAADSDGWPVTDGGSNTYSKPKFVESHQGRLAYSNFQLGTGSALKYPSHLILSRVDHAEDFTFDAVSADGAYIVGVGTGDGQQIVGMRSINIPAVNQSQLIVVKNRSVYSITGSSSIITDADSFDVVQINGDYGAFNNRCIVRYGNDLLLLNEYGIISVTTSITSGNILTSLIESDLVSDVISRINLSAKDKCWGIHLKNRREIWFFIPTGASTVCNEAIVYRYATPGLPNSTSKWSRRTDVGSKFQMAHGVVLNRVFYIGSYTGIVGTMFTSSKYDDIGIPWKYEYAAYDFGNEKQIKAVKNAEAQFKIRSDQIINIETDWVGGNSNDTWLNQLLVSTTISSATYDDVNYDEAYYGDQEELNVEFKAPGDGRKLKFTLSGTTNNTGPEFLGLLLVPEYGAISQSWN